jgi:hypothetical protein
VDRRFSTEPRACRRPVRVEQLLVDAVQRVVHDRPVDRVEEQITDPRAAERPRQVHVAAVPHVARVLLGAVGVGQLRPVGDDAGEAVEAQRARLVDE